MVSEATSFNNAISTRYCALVSGKVVTWCACNRLSATAFFTARWQAGTLLNCDFSERPAIAGTVFDATAAAGVEIHMISTSLSTVSFLTNEDQAIEAVSKLHENFLVP